MADSVVVNAPFFSVIVPVYNKGPCIARSLGSVINQSFTDFELIVVCDPCSDNSLAEVAKFSDHRVRVFHRASAGAGGYAARNLGIHEARAEWVAFLDADDEWLPDHLQTAYQLIQQAHTGIVASGWTDSWPDGRFELAPFYNRYQQQPARVLTFSQYLQESVAGRSALHTNIITVNKKLLTTVGGFPEKMCRRGGDIATWLALLNGAGGVLCATASTAIYHREDAGVTVAVAPEVEGNCVYMRCNNLMEQQQAPALKTLLKRFSNLHIAFGLVRRASAGKLRWVDCRFHYREVALLQHVVYRTFSILPAGLQRFCWRLYRKIK